jgi:hypothetical protein
LIWNCNETECLKALGGFGWPPDVQKNGKWERKGEVVLKER